MEKYAERDTSRMHAHIRPITPLCDFSGAKILLYFVKGQMRYQVV